MSGSEETKHRIGFRDISCPFATGHGPRDTKGKLRNNIPLCWADTASGFSKANTFFPRVCSLLVSKLTANDRAVSLPGECGKPDAHPFS